MPNPDRSRQIGNGEQDGVEEHEHLEQNFPAKINHARTGIERVAL
jgi:hypothetical protein